MEPRALCDSKIERVAKRVKGTTQINAHTRSGNESPCSVNKIMGCDSNDDYYYDGIFIFISILMFLVSSSSLYSSLYTGGDDTVSCSQTSHFCEVSKVPLW